MAWSDNATSHRTRTGWIKHKGEKLLGVLAVMSVVAAGGSACTAANSTRSTSVTTGATVATVAGVTATSITYHTNASHDTITSVTLVLTGDTTAKEIQIAFNDDAPSICSGAGAYENHTTAYRCAVRQATSTATKFTLTVGPGIAAGKAF